MKLKKWTLLVLAIVVMALALTACQPADDSVTDAPALKMPGAGTKIMRKDMCKQAFSLKPPAAGRMYPAGLRRFFISKDFRAEKRGFNCQIIAGML